MPFDRVAALARARLVVHATMGFAAEYSDDEVVVPVPLTVGWFNRFAMQGNLAEVGYSDVVDNVNRVRFNLDELNEKGVVPKRAGKVRLLDPLHNGVVLILDNKHKSNGPINVIWGVSPS